MQRAISFAVFAILALATFGCGGGNLEKEIIGKFTMSIDSSKMKEDQKAMVKMAEPMIAGISMELKEGGKVSLTAMGKTEEGTWKLDGTSLSITDPKGKTDKMEVKDGGKTLVPDPKTMGMDKLEGAVVTFNKSAK